MMIMMKNFTAVDSTLDPTQELLSTHSLNSTSVEITDDTHITMRMNNKDHFQKV